MRSWLSLLSQSDAVFAPLHRAAVLDPKGWPLVAQAHQEAVADAAQGWPLDEMAERVEWLRESADDAAEIAKHDSDRKPFADAQMAEAWGYAMGLTAVLAAIRERAPEELPRVVDIRDEVSLEDTGHRYPSRWAA